jgi:hypothetical protein
MPGYASFHKYRANLLSAADRTPQAGFDGKRSVPQPILPRVRKIAQVLCFQREKNS